MNRGEAAEKFVCVCVSLLAGTVVKGVSILKPTSITLFDCPTFNLKDQETPVGNGDNKITFSLKIIFVADS